MFRVLPKYQSQNVVLIAILFVFPALFFTGAVESAQTRNSSKPKTAPTKKNEKVASNKKTQAKATPTPKKTADKKDKKNSSSAQNSAKNKASDKSRQTSSSKANQKNATKKESDSRQNRDARQKNDDRRSSSANRRGSNSGEREERYNRRSNAKSGTRNDDSKNKSSRATRNNERNDRRNRNADRRNASNKTEPKSSPRTESRSSNARSKTVKSKPEIVSNEEVVETVADEKEMPQIIVTDVAARVRSQAKATAPETNRLRLGTVLKVREKNPAWYRVQYDADGKTADGWISANSVNDLNAGTKEELYRQIVERNYKSEMDFAAASEMATFLTEAGGELGNSNLSAELEYKRLLALRTALKKIPAGQAEQSPYREFLRANEKSVVYSDPSAEWFVASNQFWDLHRKYPTSALADQIAWEAAQNPLPGECEGYANCYLFAQRMTNGEYLRLHPNGAKAVQALLNLTEFLDSMVDDGTLKAARTGPTDVTDRAEFNNLLAELRTIISRMSLTDKNKALKHLQQVAEAYR